MPAAHEMAMLSEFDMFNLPKLERRLKRLKRKESKLAEEHRGKETTRFNYHAGFELGHVRGKIYVLEELIDDLNKSLEE